MNETAVAIEDAATPTVGAQPSRVLILHREVDQTRQNVLGIESHLFTLIQAWGSKRSIHRHDS
jgi:hypothetical protein